jgi:hypothetical protein
MTVDRTHVLATPGMDAHGSYVALSATATAWTCIMAATTSPSGQARQHPVARPGQGHGDGLRTGADYAERRGITFRARDAELNGCAEQCR